MPSESVDFQEILYSQEGGLAVLTLNRPELMNAFSSPMSQEILQACQAARDDPAVKVLVITGAGRAFCAGANPRALLKAREERQPFRPMSWGGLTRLLRFMEKPVIAAVNGACVGGGMELATLCDIRLASERAKFGVGFIRMGSAPSPAVCYYLPRLVGMSTALEMMWTGRVFDAQEALRIGYVSRVVPPEELMNAAREIALPIVRGPSIAIGVTKTLAYRGQEFTLEQALEAHRQAFEMVEKTEDAREGPRAWVEKREPQFKGK